MNGVFINNRQLKRSVLRDGDNVELGDVSFTFRLLDEAPEVHGATVMLDRPEELSAVLDPLSPNPFKFDDGELDFEPDIFDDLDDLAVPWGVDDDPFDPKN